MRENTDQKNSRYGHFSRSVRDCGMDLLFLEKCFGSRLKTFFNPIDSITDFHESKVGNGNLHRENVRKQINLFKGVSKNTLKIKKY